MKDPLIPKGYIQVEAYTNGQVIVLCGEPPSEERDPECELHNCDAMGCTSLGPHVLYRGRVEDGRGAWLREWVAEAAQETGDKSMSEQSREQAAVKVGVSNAVEDVGSLKVALDAVTRQRDSLRLELAASKHNHKADNTLLIGQRDALAGACRRLLLWVKTVPSAPNLWVHECRELLGARKQAKAALAALPEKTEEAEQ